MEETAAEVTAQPTVMDTPQGTEETTVEAAPVEETAAEVTAQPAVMGAPLITEETSADETDETGAVTPEESAF